MSIFPPPYFVVPKCEQEIKILHEEADFLLVEKPEFLLSIPGRGPENRDSVVTRLIKIYPTAKTCHRLDLDTSGIMIVALTPFALMQINLQFQDKKVQKVYEAIVYGLLKEDHGVIDLPIAPDWESRPRQKICKLTGKNAVTRYEVVARDEVKYRTRVRLYPITGRSHQLRLHMRELGHPILGCDLYAHDEALALSSRLMLHAREVNFIHPRTLCQVHGVSVAPF